jgi:hypothetical protein
MVVLNLPVIQDTDDVDLNVVGNSCPHIDNLH